MFNVFGFNKNSKVMHPANRRSDFDEKNGARFHEDEG
jgi:hypothetical protein